MKYIEFLDTFETIVLSSEKEKTTRLITTKDFCYYSAFMYKSHRFEIDAVERKSVLRACVEHHKEEMFDSADDMYEALKSIYKDAVNAESECFVISFHRIY